MRMRIALALGVVLLIAVSAYGFANPGSLGSVQDSRNTPEVTIILADRGFEPRYIRISKGTKVTFATTRSNQFWPASNEHPTHSIYGEFDPKRPLEANESWSFVFEKEGGWSYHDHIRSYFTGRVYVE